jgi:hypothetical protein
MDTVTERAALRRCSWVTSEVMTELKKVGDSGIELEAL